MIPLIVVGVIVLILVIWLIVSYNKLVSEKLKVEDQWSQIDVVLKQRADVIPNLVNTVKGYAEHEKDLLENVTQARSQYLNAGNQKEAIQASDALSQLLNRLMAVAEAYPDLKANNNFMELQRQIHNLEEKIADFRQFYNDTVLRYNRRIELFPSNIVARLFHFQRQDFFKVEEADKTVPDVQF